MNKEEKKDFVADLHTRLEKAEGAFIVDYKGLNVDTGQSGDHNRVDPRAHAGAVRYRPHL
jgi:hypothetical protein